MADAVEWGNCVYRTAGSEDGWGDGVVRWMERTRIDVMDCVPTQLKVMMEWGLLEEREREETESGASLEGKRSMRGCGKKW